MGCVALADHLRATSWPPKFRPHLPEKYDDTSNPSEFLQVYVTAITAAGGNTAVMATYFHVALSRPARTWLMNLAPGSIYTWEELFARFVANFASTYQQHGVEAHLHAVRQEPGETLRTFISRFTKVRGTIPRISDASIITAFRKGYVIKKCWKSWPHMTWRLSPRSSLWLTSASGPPRAVHGTRPHKPGLPRRVARVPSPGTVKRKRRAATTRGRSLLRWSSQLRPGTRAIATNAHGRRRVTAARALYTPTVATAPRSVTRSLISRNTSANALASGVSNLPRTAPHLIAVLAKKRSTTARWPRLSETLGISHPKGT
jgi:hypothetical protein